jgi:hypothetical protein
MSEGWQARLAQERYESGAGLDGRQVRRVDGSFCTPKRRAAWEKAGGWKGEGAGLVGRVYSFLADYLVLPEPSLLAVAAWAMAGWLADCWDRFPHLAVTSPDGRCGKTRLLELLLQVCRNATLNVNTSPAALYRRIADTRPTLLLDEAQGLGRRGSEMSEVLYEIFCAGVSKDAVVTRCVGANHEPHDFPVFCPKAVALVGALKGLLADRSLAVRMKRKTKSERVRKARMTVIEGEGNELKAAIERWAGEGSTQKRVKKVYGRLEPFDIENDRMAELLLPLQAVLAAELGADIEANYPLAVLHDYALALDAGGQGAAGLSHGLQLLAACRAEFATAVNGFLSTGVLLTRLCERKDEPWPEFNHGRPLSAEKLAGLLREYGVGPRRDEKQERRGYFAADFADAWGRYLPPAP